MSEIPKGMVIFRADHLKNRPVDKQKRVKNIREGFKYPFCRGNEAQAGKEESVEKKNQLLHGKKARR